MGGCHVWVLWVASLALWACASGQKAEEQPFGLTLSKVKKLQEWYGNPVERAVEGLPKLLLGEHLPPPKENKKYDLSWLEGVYLPSTDPSVVSNEACIEDTKDILQVLESNALMGLVLNKNHFWPLLLPDSWGKVPDGILNGNYLLWGMQEECTGLDVNEEVHVPFLYNYSASFKGRYCLISTSSPKVNSSSNPLKPFSFQVPEAQVGMLAPYPIIGSVFQYGTCIPASCKREDMVASLEHVLNVTGNEIQFIDCRAEDDEIVLDSGDIAYIVVLSLLGTLLLAGAAADFILFITDSQHLRKGPLQYLLVFSAYSNLKKIFHVTTKENPSVISCLHGMRVLSMIWVVWGHGYMFLLGVTKNVLGTKQLVDDLADQIVANATFSVDTFFFMSGLLVAYGVMREHKRTGRINWIMYYVHRFIRLAPPIAMTAGAIATIAKYSLVGPYGANVERSYVESCKENWWADTLFVSNLLTRGHICLPQCWYTGVDTQIYVILPLIFIPLLWKPKLGLPWMGVVTVVSFIIPTVIFAVYNAAPALFFARPEVQMTEMIDTYGKPWCRAHVYLIGCWGGLLFHKIQGKKITLAWWQVLIGWVGSTCLACAVLFGVANYNTLDNPDPMPEEVSVIYGGFSRGAWALALLWIVFACHTGYGGPINTFLSHPSWQPLSRLTYAMFLTTIPVQILYSGAVFLPLYLDHLNKIVETCGYLFIGGLLAIWLSLMTEGPVLGLEKLLLRRPGRSEEQKKQ